VGNEPRTPRCVTNVGTDACWVAAGVVGGRGGLSLASMADRQSSSINHQSALLFVRRD
jgi:hypothetical protein